MGDVTEKQATAILDAVAEWMGRQGHGASPGEAAPTGEDAANRGLGPMLNMTWDWPGQPTPTVILEGGPYDWAILVCDDDRVQEVAKKNRLFLEPYAGYALCVYRD